MDNLDKPNTTGRYVYGIAEYNDVMNLGDIGIDKAAVYTIPYQDFCAIVHDCTEEPYESSDDEVVRRWIVEHQEVLDIAQEKFTTVIPLGFDNIIKRQNETENCEVAVQNWLKEDLARIAAVIDRIRGKDEFVIQISCDNKSITSAVLQQSENIKKIQEEINAKPSGLAYIYKKQLEKLIKSESENITNIWFQEFYSLIKTYAEETTVEKNKKISQEKTMIINISCLVKKASLDGLGKVLDEINNREGFFVHFSGPWPPYSFVDKMTTTNDDTKK